MGQSILGGLAEWLRGCPLLEGCALGVDWLPDKPGPRGALHLSVEAGGGGGLRRYMGGQGLRDYPFAVRVLGGYGPDAARNLAGGALLENLGLWMEREARRGRLPALPEGALAVAVEAEGAAVLTSASGGAAVYRLGCVLRYLRELSDSD